MAAPGLGDFAKLPVEIRLLIWAEFSPSGQKRGKTDLAILRTSKQIHEEVLHCIYENVSILAFLIKAKFDDGYHYGETASYLSFDIWGGSALLQSVGNNNDDSDSDNEGDELELVAGAQRWRFSSAQDALSRGFEYLPLDKMPTVISIEAPDPNDPGQLIRLCLRIQQVVKLLKSLKKPIYKVVMRFGDPRDWMRKKGEGSEWTDTSEGEAEVVGEQEERAEKEKKEKLQFSLEEMGYPGLTFIQTDIEAVLFPFHSLDNVKHFIFNTATTKLLFPNSKLDLDFVPANVVETSRVKLRDLCLYEFPADLEGWNDMYNYYLHTRLDFVEGETAFLLRLDRFALWEEQKYDEMFLRLVKKYPIQIDALDVNGLEGLKTRYIYAHTARYYVTRQDIKDLPTDIDLRTLAPHLPPEEWGEVFWGGLPPLEIDRFTDEFGENFWLKFKIYAKKWSLSQWDLREQQQQKQSPDLQGLDAFASAVSDAQGEWEQMITYHPDIEQRLVDEFGLRRYEIGE